MFYNTINEVGATLFDLKVKSEKQEDLILWYFKFTNEMTPFEVKERLDRVGRVFPITSVRRAMTELTRKGLLIKTENTRVGEYGVKNYLWRLSI